MRFCNRPWVLLVALYLWNCLPQAQAQTVRIKDITDFEGARPNQLYGFGLVVGLGNTGGRSQFTQQVAADMLQKLSVNAKAVRESQIDPVFRSGEYFGCDGDGGVRPVCTQRESNRRDRVGAG
jgi:hypothetical protein